MHPAQQLGLRHRHHSRGCWIQLQLKPGSASIGQAQIQLTAVVIRTPGHQLPALIVHPSLAETIRIGMEAITAGLMPLVGGLQQQAGLPTMGTCDKGLGRGLELIQRLEPMQAGLMAPMTLQGKRVDGSTTKQQHRGCRHRQWHHEATAPLQHQPLS